MLGWSVGWLVLVGGGGFGWRYSHQRVSEGSTARESWRGLLQAGRSAPAPHLVPLRDELLALSVQPPVVLGGAVELDLGGLGLGDLGVLSQRLYVGAVVLWWSEVARSWHP